MIYDSLSGLGSYRAGEAMDKWLFRLDDLKGLSGADRSRDAAELLGAGWSPSGWLWRVVVVVWVVELLTVAAGCLGMLEGLR